MMLYERPKLTLSVQPQQEDDDRNKFSEMNKMLDNVINSKIQAENQAYIQQQRALNVEEQKKERQRFDFIYDEMSSIWGEEALKPFKDMGMKPELADEYMRTKYYSKFVEDHRDGFTMADIQSEGNKLTGDAIKSLMPYAKDSISVRETELNNLLYSGAPLKNYSEFTTIAQQLGLDPLKYKSLWDEYQQSNKLTLGGNGTTGDGGTPPPSPLKPTATSAEATAARDLFDLYKLPLGDIPLNSESAVHLQEAGQRLTAYKTELDKARLAIDPSIHSQYTLAQGNSVDTLFVTKGSVGFKVKKSGNVKPVYKIDNKWVEVDPEDLKPDKKAAYIEIVKSGYYKLEKLRLARKNIEQATKNEYNRLKNNNSVVPNIKKLYGN